MRLDRESAILIAAVVLGVSVCAWIAYSSRGGGITGDRAVEISEGCGGVRWLRGEFPDASVAVVLENNGAVWRVTWRGENLEPTPRTAFAVVVIDSKTGAILDNYTLCTL